MSTCRLDHVVVAAATLAQGAAWIEDILGVTVPEGGTHQLMGTHNRLMQLGPGCFLEIIAIDPGAAKPPRPRWFNLDHPDVAARLAERPRLHTWVVRTGDIETAVAAAPADTGPIEQGRRGDLSWRITIPHDGSMPQHGLFPTLIQWPDRLMPDGPASNMADLGCRLERLRIAHWDPDALRTALAAIGAEALASVDQASGERAPGLTALITCPMGVAALS